MGLEKLWFVFVICLAGCAVGFKSYVWFMSIGYGMAIAMGGISLLILFSSQLTLTTIGQCLVLIVYGIRLAGFLYKREVQSQSYKKAMKGISDKRMPVFVLALMWIFMGIYYTMQVSPVFFRLYNGNRDCFLPWLGIVISIAGIVIESLGDKQKSEQKKKIRLPLQRKVCINIADALIISGNC